ncbi:MAG: hypothetical protein C0467_02245 [Planctomycetaceae bacterium]|nr:hypothetical protein [Planctomycetaceae bacterium]
MGTHNRMSIDMGAPDEKIFVAAFGLALLLSVFFAVAPQSGFGIRGFCCVMWQFGASHSD